MLAPRMAAISVVSTAAFVGLAAIARGPEAFWAEPPLRALTGATGVTVIVPCSAMSECGRASVRIGKIAGSCRPSVRWACWPPSSRASNRLLKSGNSAIGTRHVDGGLQRLSVPGARAARMAIAGAHSDYARKNFSGHFQLRSFNSFHVLLSISAWLLAQVSASANSLACASPAMIFKSDSRPNTWKRGETMWKCGGR